MPWPGSKPGLVPKVGDGAKALGNIIDAPAQLKEISDLLNTVSNLAIILSLHLERHGLVTHEDIRASIRRSIQTHLSKEDADKCIHRLDHSLQVYRGTKEQD